MDHKRSILLNSFVEYVRSLLAMVEQNFSYESVFRYLRTGLTGFSDEEIDIVENYVIALGIRGYKKMAGEMDSKSQRDGGNGIGNVLMTSKNVSLFKWKM